MQIFKNKGCCDGYLPQDALAFSLVTIAHTANLMTLTKTVSPLPGWLTFIAVRICPRRPEQWVRIFRPCIRSHRSLTSPWISPGCNLSAAQVSLGSLPVIAITRGAPRRLSRAHVACWSPNSRGNVKDAKSYSLFKVHESDSFEILPSLDRQREGLFFQWFQKNFYFHPYHQRQQCKTTFWNTCFMHFPGYQIPPPHRQRERISFSPV